MKRRTFLAATAAVMMAPLAAVAGDYVDYTPGLVEQELAAGKTLLVDYYASWCGTCQAQGRVLEALRKENPAYDEAMTFIRVDWDTYSEHEVTVFREIPRRSTLIVLRGDEELGRIVAQTSKSQIQALLDKGL